MSSRTQQKQDFRKDVLHRCIEADQSRVLTATDIVEAALDAVEQFAADRGVFSKRK